jgi:thiamine pyrophosphokinase
VSLLPLSVPALGVTTDGLLYPLRDETLPAGPARGLSNVRVSARASVTLRHGHLLVVETRVDQPE